MAQLEATLAAGHSAGGARVAVHGLGGVGKTQLAVEYAHRHSEEYEAICWLRAEQPATLAAAYADLAPVLGISQENLEKQSAVIDAVRGWFERTAGWLLVFDDAIGPEEVYDYLPRGGSGHVIITSRNPNWDVAKALALGEMEPAEALAFLVKRTGQEDEEAAAELAKALKYLPLALAQAGAYITETRTSMAAYLKMLPAHRAKLWRAGKPTDYRDTVWTTWRPSLKRVRRECPAGTALLMLCAFLGSENIPLDVLRLGARYTPAPLRAALLDPVKRGRGRGRSLPLFVD